MSDVVDELRLMGWQPCVKGAVEIERLRAELAAEREKLAKHREALQAAHHALTVTHNLRSTDMTVEAFNDALARGVGRDCLEFFIDNSKEIARIDAALNGGGDE